MLLGLCALAAACGAGTGTMGGDTGLTPGPDAVTLDDGAVVEPDATVSETGADAGPGDDATSANPCAGGSCPTVLQLAASDRNSCAVLMGGTVRCWGYNGDNQLGPTVATGHLRPIAVAGLTDVTQLAMGYAHTCARKSDGTAWCWGSGSNGQLGNGANEDSATPVQVSGLTDVVRVGAGIYHACALKSDGTVWCWGRGGALGRRGVASTPTPIQVEGLAGVTDISVAHAGTYGRPFHNTCALLTDGGVRCWGEGEAGQLGTGARDPSATPIAPMDLPPAAQITSGGAHTCALLRDGGVRCWGIDSLIGDGSREMRLVPTAVPGLANVRTILAGPRHTCALSTDGALRCWGENGSGQTGTMWTSPGSTPIVTPTPIDGPANVSLFALGENHTCIYATNGATYCFGSNSESQFGTGVSSTREFQRNAVRW